MKAKKPIAIILIVIGALLLFFSDYIAEEVAQGKLKIKRAQSQVNSVNSLFSKSKVTKPFGNALTGGAQKKIDAGQREVDRYSSLSRNLKIGGVILIIIGIGLFFIPKKK